MEHYHHHDDSRLPHDSEGCAERVWRTQDFSMFMTMMLHPSGDDESDDQLQLSRLRSVSSSPTAARRLAGCYVDLCSL